MNTVQPHSFKVGEDVSYGFNGDSYHAGKITRFTKSGHYMFTDRGNKFVKYVLFTTEYNTETFKHEYVKKEAYQSVGGTWYVFKGISNKQNPSF